MSTSPAPEYALSFSSDAVHLMERSDASAAPAVRWHERASAPFDAPDFRSEMARLRRLVANGPDARVALIIPDDQILYTSLPVAAEDDVAAGLGRALDGLTPYPVADLAWDWRPVTGAAEGRDVRVAAVARQTLREAEDFARRHGFAADGFVADPAEGLFPEAPRFSAEAKAAQDHDLPGDAPERAGEAAASPEGGNDADVSEVTVPATSDEAPSTATVAAGSAADASASAGEPGDKDAAEVASSAPAAVAPKLEAPETTAPNTDEIASAPVKPQTVEPETTKPNDTTPAASRTGDGPAAKSDTASPNADSESKGDGQPAPASSAAAVAGPTLIATAGAVPAAGSRVTDFLPADLPPSAVPAPVEVVAPPSDLIDTSDAPTPAREPVPLPDRARAVLDRAAEARARRTAEPVETVARHPGARGGIGGLLVMLGALLLGLMMIWSFATPGPGDRPTASETAAPAAVADAPPAAVPAHPER